MLGVAPETVDEPLPGGLSPLSSQEFLDHFAGHIGQSVIPPGMAVGEFLVVQAHQVQDGGVEVVNVNRLLRGLDDAVLIRCAVGDAAFDTRTRAAKNLNTLNYGVRGPRLSAVLLKGVRPNSVVHTTSTSSNRPTCFRS